MKKIFGMFAVAALAATALTGCGGGGSEEDGPTINKLCFKTLRIQAPGPIIVPDEDEEEENPDPNPLPDEENDIITGDGNSFGGSMFIYIKDKENSKKAQAKVSFGIDNKGQYNGSVEIVGGTTEAPEITVYVDSGSNVGSDEEAWAWFANFLTEDLEEGDTLVGLPAPYITLNNWVDDRNGTCTVRFTLGTTQAFVTNVSFELTER